MTNKDDIYSDDFEGALGARVADFLPSPEQLVRREQMQRVTMELPKNTVAFFKHHAKELGGSYQVMIRELLVQYAQAHSGK